MNKMFSDAIELNDIITVNQMLDNDITDIDIINFFGIRIAAEKGYLDLVKILHKYGADINTDYGYPLRWACRNEHYDVVKYLLQNDAIINYNSYINKSVIYDAILSGNENIIDLVIYYGANIKTTIINYIIYNSTISILNLILKRLNEQNRNYILNTTTEVDIYDLPLIIACDLKKVDIINLLVRYGANVNIFNGLPLSYCIQHCDYTLVNLLINNGANPKLGNSIYYAVYKSLYDITKLLLDKGANAAIEDSYLLRDCLMRGNIPIAELLINYGANLHCNDNCIITDVLTTRNPNVIQFLKTHGIVFTLQEQLILDNIDFNDAPNTIINYNNNDNNCIICLDVSSNVITPCGHSGCINCFKEWFIQNVKCPMCKCDVDILYNI